MRQLPQALSVGFFHATTFLPPSQFYPAHPNGMWIQESRRGTQDRSQYLEKVGNIRMDLVNDSNAIAEDGCSLIRMQSGLKADGMPAVSISLTMALGLG